VEQGRVWLPSHAQGLTTVTRRPPFLAIRQRGDGSQYLHKKKLNCLRFLDAFAFIGLIAIALILVEQAIIRSSATLAQEAKPPSAQGITKDDQLEGELRNPKPGEWETSTDRSVPPIATTVPSLWPLAGRLTDSFGYRRSPFASGPQSFIRARTLPRQREHR
jgi:hypothetical protein